MAHGTRDCVRTHCSGVDVQIAREDEQELLLLVDVEAPVLAAEALDHDARDKV